MRHAEKDERGKAGSYDARLDPDFEEMRLNCRAMNFSSAPMKLSTDTISRLEASELAAAARSPRRSPCHEQEHSGDGKFEKPCQPPYFISPVAVVVEQDARILRLQNLSERGDVGRVVAIDLDRDQSWDGKSLQNLGFSNPGLDELQRLLPA